MHSVTQIWVKNIYSVFFFISTKVFVHLTNLELFYLCLKYLKLFNCLLHFIKKWHFNLFKSYLFIIAKINFKLVKWTNTFVLIKKTHCIVYLKSWSCRKMISEIHEIKRCHRLKNQNLKKGLLSAKILLLPPKYEIIMVPFNHSFFQY